MVSVASTVEDAATSLMFRQTLAAQLGGRLRPTFRRSEFRLAWMATRIHVFLFVVELTEVPPDGLISLAKESRRWAKRHKGGLPAGLQTGSVAMPVFIVPEIGGLRDWADSPQPKAWGSGSFPIVISSDGRDAAYRRNSAMYGVVYERFLRQLAERIVSAVGAG
jgi:hypothetical protein